MRLGSNSWISLRCFGSASALCLCFAQTDASLLRAKRKRGSVTLRQDERALPSNKELILQRLEQRRTLRTLLLAPTCSDLSAVAKGSAAGANGDCSSG